MADGMKFIDLFAGLGGFHIGLSDLGHECVFACESDAGLQEVYWRNFGIRPHGDIRLLKSDEVPDHDILCAGFPCQPFSKAGEQLGLACTRDGDLFDNLIRILRKRRPRFAILENVANLEKHDAGETYFGMRTDLESLGYTVDERVLSPHSFGIPQVRNRLFIVCSQTGLDDFRWPIGNDREPTIFDVLDDDPVSFKSVPENYQRCLDVWQEFLDLFPQGESLPSFPIWTMEFGADYPYMETTPTQLTTRKLTKFRGTHGISLRDLPPSSRMDAIPSYARTKNFPPWKQQFIRQNRELYARHRYWIDKWLPKLLEFPSSLQKLEWNCKGEPRDISKHIVQFRASGVRIKRSSTAPALIAMTTTQVPIIPSRGRYMTVRECSRLQGLGNLTYLPDAPTRAYRALGNAVNADLVRAIAASLLGQRRRAALGRVKWERPRLVLSR